MEGFSRSWSNLQKSNCSLLNNADIKMRNWWQHSVELKHWSVNAPISWYHRWCTSHTKTLLTWPTWPNRRTICPRISRWSWFWSQETLAMGARTSNTFLASMTYRMDPKFKSTTEMVKSKERYQAQRHNFGGFIWYTKVLMTIRENIGSEPWKGWSCVHVCTISQATGWQETVFKTYSYIVKVCPLKLE